MKTINSPKQWPDDYRDWTGTFRDLAITATEVLAVLEPQAKAPTERLLRYYQNQGVLGRGEKQGNRALFAFADLERVVAAKGLVQQNWTLDNAAKLFSSVGPHPEAVSSLLYASPTPMSSPGPALNASADSGMAPACPAGGEDASSVVVRLMASSHGLSSPHKSVRSLGALGGQVSGSVSPTLASDVSGQLNASPVQSIRPTSWLTVYLDEGAAQGAAPAERAQARATLEALLKTLR